MKLIKKLFLLIALFCFGIQAFADSSARWEQTPNVAQYKEADWKNFVTIAKNTTVEEAKRIAEQNPSIDYFFYMKGGQMVLENYQDQMERYFDRGDAVFFSGTPWWGSAPGFADGYTKA